MNGQKILLHSCCAPCSAAVLEWLIRNGYETVLFYYNPNIYPQEEYEKRKNELTKYAAKKRIKVIDGDYNYNRWKQTVEGFENEPERGARCLRCFKMRLNKTAELANTLGISLFATTLSSSRWKDLNRIDEAGSEAAMKYAGLTFLNKNWRKDGLQQRRNDLIKENNFYNQQYCGCEYSTRVLRDAGKAVII
ncbi:MAG: epoxyqueuosine reductase QueH [Bacteroidales bacterium]|jgi:predicted adenine nucleotide alpha hydrolase (AANH) superfamily ATPase|nr:epoxyqueuosine reductase QueH [Bacteroidales bacterium]